ncbi:hypothetical protein CVT26_013803 [Gymnopilus dilepis]|uniref:Uncharacterized protein n=1 Tax=Gymnopilus dilepis TaxID=231916 RepID=A0A409WSV6_9AGAR|nr:hypothetical protein CVT26_013803 [Gymnopilus dilepis]
MDLTATGRRRVSGQPPAPTRANEEHWMRLAATRTAHVSPLPPPHWHMYDHALLLQVMAHFIRFPARRAPQWPKNPSFLLQEP